MGDRPKTVLTKRMRKDDAEAFEAFVRRSPFAACQQTRAWAENAPQTGRQDYLYFLCREGAETIGAAVVRRSRLAPGAALATVQRGPVVAEASHLEPVLTALKAALREEGFSSLVVGPRAAEEMRLPFADALRSCGFAPLPPSAQSLHIATGKVPLAGPEEAIFGRFKQRGRRAIRKVETAGVSVREASEADMGACADLLADFHIRRPDYDVGGQLSLEGHRRLIAAEGGALLVAEQAGRIVGYHSFVRQGPAALWLAMVSDDDAKAPRSYALLWEGMKRARALGLSYYDLAGLSADGAENGRDQFKHAFAPEREELLPAHVTALRPLRHAIFFTARQGYRAWRKRRGKG